MQKAIKEAAKRNDIGSAKVFLFLFVTLFFLAVDSHLLVLATIFIFIFSVGNAMQ